MSRSIDRRAFVRSGTAAGLAAAAAPGSLLAHGSTRDPSAPRDESGPGGAPAVRDSRSVRPVVISDLSGINYRNGGPESAVERAFRGITEGEDVLDALIAGVNIPELDPEEAGIGYGGRPNAEGVVQLDSCCMHGPRRWAGGVAALEGVRTPSRVAKAVMEHTDHHLLAGKGARDFARMMGFRIEEDLNTEKSRALWLEWKRRVDPDHYLDPDERRRAPPDDPEGSGVSRRGRHRGYAAALEMMREGLLDAGSFWGTINCDGIGPDGDLCGVTTTSGTAWKIPGRVGDSPILGAGLYVDDDVGAAGSTGRGEANLYNLTSFLIVEMMRGGMGPVDAGMAGLERIRANTVDERLLNSRGEPTFDIRFFIVNKRGEFAGVSMYGFGEKEYAVCTENGAERRSFETLLDGSPTD